MALTLRDLSHDWVTGLCRDLVGPSEDGSELHVRSFALTPLASDQGVLSRYQPSTDEAIVGHRVLTAHTFQPAGTGDGVEQEVKLLLKSKAPGAVVRRRVEAVYRRLDARLADAQRKVSPSILDDCHTRELQLYQLDRKSLRSITPAIARVWLAPAAQIFVVAMELLEDVRHARTLHDLDLWLAADLDCALTQLARVHGDFLGKLDPAAPPPWLLPFQQLHNAHLLAYQAELLRYNAGAFPELFFPARVRQLEALLASAAGRHRAILARPLTLIHGDFTPRNVCLKVGAPGGMRLCAYDWELAQVHLPARDVCELLCYALSPQRGWRDAATARLLDRYRGALADAAGRPIAAADFEHDLALALAELCTFKLLVQGITHQLLGNRTYFERLVHNAFDGLAAFDARTYQERTT